MAGVERSPDDRGLSHDKDGAAVWRCLADFDDCRSGSRRYGRRVHDFPHVLSERETVSVGQSGAGCQPAPLYSFDKPSVSSTYVPKGSVKNATAKPSAATFLYGT